MIRISFLLSLLQVCALLSGQVPEKATWLSVNDGLSQGMVFDILQSRDGFLWIATKDGLNRYDGYRFEVFFHDPFNPFSPAGNEIYKLHEDPEGRIWLSYRHGLDVLLPNDGLVLHLQTPFSGAVHAIASLPDGRSFLATESSLWVVEIPKGALKQAAMKGQPYPDLSFTAIEAPSGRLTTGFYFNSIFVSGNQELIVGSSEGIFRIGQSNAAYHLQAEALQETDSRLIGEDTEGRIWASTPEGLRVQLHPDSPFEKVTTDYPGSWLMDPGGRLWTWQKNRIRKWTPSLLIQGSGPDFEAPILPDFKPTEVIYFTCIEIDRSGNAWVGSSGYGLVKINTSTPSFHNYLSGVSMRAVFEDPAGNLFSLFGSRPFYSDKNLDSLGPNPWLEKVEKGKRVPWIVFDGLGNGWTKTGRDELMRIDGSSKDTRTYSMPGRGLVVLENGKMLSAGEEALYEFNPATGKTLTFPYDRPLKLTTDVTFNSNLFYRGSEADIWLLTTEGLLHILPVGEAYRFQLFQNNPSDRSSLSNNEVFSAVEDPVEPDRYLWVGTRGGGLNRLDRQTRIFQHYGPAQGLPDRVIYGLLADQHGHLWISTNKGLCRFHVRDESVKNFTSADGLQSNEFNHSSYLKTADGRMIFGGVNGLTVFQPDSLRFNDHRPVTALTGLQINNQAISLRSRPHEKEAPARLQRTGPRSYQLELEHDQNLLTLEFAALELTRPAQNQYRYQLVRHHALGSDEGGDWVALGARNSIQFANLKPGRYTFRVLGSNNDGIWGEQPALLEFTIRPPLWATPGAYLLYALLLAGAVWLFFAYRLRRKLDLQEARRLKELDEFKNRFFTNITHEFRTPLTVILGASKQVESKVNKELKNKAQLIQRSGERLLRLINQILDLAKLESDSLRIKYIQDDVIPFLHEIVESLQPLADSRKVQLRLESPASGIFMDYDPERLLQIVYNLLSNALKHTPSGGEVRLQAAVTEFQKQQALEIRVSDTGEGIPGEHLPHIFERFYQVEKNQALYTEGTGIGLSLSRELVRAMNGKIDVQSAPEKGTTFTVLLPITNTALPAGQQSSLRPMPQPEIEKGLRPSPATDPGAQVLIIEDHPDVAEYLEACLGLHYQLDFAYNGREGVEKALETVPDLIVSDVMMPEKDGFEVCELLKNDLRTSHIPIVLLTAKAGVESRIAGLRRGADAYLAKPFHEEELRATLANLLELRRKLQKRFARQHQNPDGPPAPPVEPGLSDEEAFLQDVRDIIQQRLSDTAFTVEDLSRSLGLSRRQLHRKLLALTGQPPSALIREMRLEKAKELLQTQKMNVSETAYQVGFDDPKYFSRVFKKAYGVPPSKI